MRYGEFTYELFSIIMEVSNGKTKEEIAEEIIGRLEE